MRTYRFKLRPLTPWSTPWHADTIFGSLCWELLGMQGEESLKRFLRRCEAGDPPFVISDALPEGWLPRPLFIRLHQLPGLNFKARASNWLSESQFRTVIHAPRTVLPEPFLPEPVRASRELHAAIDRFSGTTGGEGVLFEVEQWSFDRKNNPGLHQLDLYVKTNDSLDLVTALLRSLEASGYGKKKSIGRGAFQLIGEATPCEWMDDTASADGFVSLSHFIPAPTDSTDGVWDLLTKYPKYGARAPAPGPFKGRLTVLRPGSAFRVKGDVLPFYGRILRNLQKGYPDPMHFGFAFAVPVRWPQG
jgi:CRISPR-associated protein Csm4